MRVTDVCAVRLCVQSQVAKLQPRDASGTAQQLGCFWCEHRAATHARARCPHHTSARPHFSTDPCACPPEPSPLSDILSPPTYLHAAMTLLPSNWNLSPPTSSPLSPRFGAAIAFREGLLAVGAPRARVPCARTTLGGAVFAYHVPADGEPMRARDARWWWGESPTYNQTAKLLAPESGLPPLEDGGEFGTTVVATPTSSWLTTEAGSDGVRPRFVLTIGAPAAAGGRGGLYVRGPFDATDPSHVDLTPSGSSMPWPARMVAPAFFGASRPWITQCTHSPLPCMHSRLLAQLHRSHSALTLSTAFVHSSHCRVCHCVCVCVCGTGGRTLWRVARSR
jgi:hypothetical protein